MKLYKVGEPAPCRGCGLLMAVSAYMVKHGKYRCGKCLSRAATDWARRNRSKKRAANNAYHSRISAKRAGRTAAYRQNHPDRKAAHQAVQTAIRNGTMVRQPCACGAGRAHAHHDDYSRPLDVVWLCHRHHMERHAMLAERSKP